MPNTRDLQGESSNILLIGDTGVHKTWLLGQVPDNFIFDFDKGLAILRGGSTDYETFKEAPKGTKVGPLLKQKGLYEYSEAWPVLIKKLNEFAAQYESGKLPYKNVSLDSLTFMSHIALNHVLKSTNQELPHQGSWGAQQEYIKRVLDQLVTWPIRLICTAHIQRDNNDITGVTEKLPLVTGKLAGLLSAYFDEVYFCESEVDEKGKQSFFVRTQSTPQLRQAKSRYGVPDKTPLDWKVISKYFDQPAAKVA